MKLITEENRCWKRFRDTGLVFDLALVTRDNTITFLLGINSESNIKPVEDKLNSSFVI